ncbi:MAG: FAD-dependent oxidoreductase [Candidatus Caldatribacteriaceae bacterium]
MHCDAVILGAGVAGMTVARSLQRKYDIVVLEREPFPGGLATRLGCKAKDGECLLCGVCRALNVRKTFLAGNFPVFLGEHLREVHRAGRGFRLVTAERTIETRFVIVASGVEPFEVTKLSRYAFRRRKRIFTGFEIEEGLNWGILERLRPFRSFAFIQCVGSRNARDRQGYCSQVCCRYALRIAENLRTRLPETFCDFYYIDLQIFGAGKERLIDITRSMTLHRALPFAVEEDEDGVTVCVEGGRGPEKRRYDVVVLSVGMVPSRGTRELAAIFGLPLKEGGFIDSRRGMTGREGVFVCGAASGPMDIESAILDAQKLGERLLGENYGASPSSL